MIRLRFKAYNENGEFDKNVMIFVRKYKFLLFFCLLYVFSIDMNNFLVYLHVFKMSFFQNLSEYVCQMYLYLFRDYCRSNKY